MEYVELFNELVSSPVEQNFSISLKADVGQALQYFQERVNLVFLRAVGI
jgi:phage baseplate assembly protein W